MTTLEDDVIALAERRFSRMRPFGGGAAPPPVSSADLPPGPRWPVLAQSAGLLRFRHRFVPYLHRRYGMAAPNGALDGPYARYCGDAGSPGKGEILKFEQV